MTLIKSIIAILLISTCVFAQDYSNRDELVNLSKVSDRTVNDTFAVNNWTRIRFLNMAVRETDNKLRPNQKTDTIWTVAGTATYALNSDCYENGVVAVFARVDSANGIYQAIRSTLSRDIGQTTAEPGTGFGAWYTTYASRIRIEPTPTEVYRIEIEYESRPDQYGTTDADSSDTLTCLKPEYEQLVLDYIRYLTKKRLGLENEAAAILQDWKTNVAESRALLQREPDPMVSPQKERGL